MSNTSPHHDPHHCTLLPTNASYHTRPATPFSSLHTHFLKTSPFSTLTAKPRSHRSPTLTKVPHASIRSTSTKPTPAFQNQSDLNISFRSREISRVVTNNRQPEGRGVFVRRSIGNQPRMFTPFALLDDFHLEAGSLSKGIGFWPHFHSGLICTLTYIYPTPGNGGVAHQDHLGHKGTVQPGGVQFMAAGKGIIHSEMPVSDAAVSGLQLWVCADKEYEFAEADYQEFEAKDLPEVTQSNIWAKVIAGEAFGLKSPLTSTTPLNYVHYKMPANSLLQHTVSPNWNTFMYIVNGEGYVGDSALDQLADGLIRQGQSVFFKPGTIPGAPHDQDGCDTSRQGVTVTTRDQPLEFIMIAGKPLSPDTKVLQRGPVIHSSEAFVEQAFDDFYKSRGAFQGGDKFMKGWSATAIPKH